MTSQYKISSVRNWSFNIVLLLQKVGGSRVATSRLFFFLVSKKYHIYFPCTFINLIVIRYQVFIINNWYIIINK